MDYSNLYTIFKVKVGPVRKDGSRLVRAYGCNGREHRVQTSAIWCDASGRNATAGKNHVKPDKVIGPCMHNHVCKNYGSFILV